MDVDEFEPPKKRGRQAGAKRYNKHTLYKRVSQLKPTNMLLWEVVADQYRDQRGELEARQASVIKKFFIQKLCNNIRRPTGSSGIDEFTAMPWRSSRLQNFRSCEVVSSTSTIIVDKHGDRRSNVKLSDLKVRYERIHFEI